MKTVKFLIALSNGKTEEREGQRRKIAGEDCFIERHGYYYTIHHKATGMSICAGIRFERTVNKAERLLTSEPEALQKAKDILINAGHKYPLNK